MDVRIIDSLITGRIEPHIYAFETCSVPNFLKIGDTYRPVHQRLEEWRRRYRNLQPVYNQPAVIEDKFFRDYSVHKYVENIKGRERIKEEDFKEGVYHSKEFFRNAVPADIDEAIIDIHRSFIDKTGEYDFYSIDNITEHQKEKFTQNKEYTELRDNQKIVVDNFEKAIGKGRTKLLMYAVMRFGKTITAMSCAEVMPDCSLVVIVSAKADVKDSWESTIKTIKNFEDFVYADGEDLKTNPQLISQFRCKKKKLALCLTLQDISTNKIKDRYKELFNDSAIDLLIVDETHFGARAEQFSKAIQDDTSRKNEIEVDENDETFEKLDETVHALKSRVQLHLSGTPYRILLGNEFSEDDIICRCTYADIIDASKEWDAKYLDTHEEWENPYYGFPQMIRFAFNFNTSALRKIAEFKKRGKESVFSELFEATKNAADNSYSFVNEQEVLDFLSAINSGDKDSNVFSFLGHKRIIEGKLCHHIVMVLPTRAACDAMEALIIKHKELKPLSNYTILKASGKKRVKSPFAIKKAIQICEATGKRTLTLTVGKMLTGTTVPEWDTMIYLKGCSSPQEYDQAIYRLQNKFVKEYKDENGRVVKYNMKPQTLLVDFSPERIFRLQEQRAFYTSVNSHEKGNDKIEKEINRELKISPILYLNHDKLQEVTATNIVDEIRKYSSNRSIMDEALEVGTDYSLKEDAELYSEIMRYAPIGADGIMTMKAHEGRDESDVELPTQETEQSTRSNKEKKTKEKGETDSYEKRLSTYYSHILFFSYLTTDRVKSIADIEAVSQKDENVRISKNLGLNLSILNRLAERMHPNRRSMLEFKISNINELSHDDSIPRTEKVEKAMKQFGKWSETEIITPSKVADDMIAMIPVEKVNSDFKFLDIASKEGEFATAIYKRFGEKLKNNIYSLPTSSVAYEFTRKVYEELGIPVENIVTSFNTYDLLSDNNETYKEIFKRMKINAIVGNPPYNNAHSKDKKTVNRAFASAVYPHFIDIAEEVTLSYISMITPSRWMTKTGQGISESWVEEKLNCNHFVFMRDFYNSLDCFGNYIELKGGVNYFLYDRNYKGKCNYVFTQNNQEYCSEDFLDSKKAGIVIRDSHASSILDKIIEIEGLYYVKENFSKLVSPQHFYDKDGFLTTSWSGYVKERDNEHNIKCFISKQKDADGFGWVKSSDVHKNIETKALYKVFVSKAYNGGDSYPHQIIGKPIYGGKNCVCSQTYLVIGYNMKEPLSPKECKNIISYMHTRFFRYMVYIKKKTQDNPSNVFQFVPLQDFTESWTDEKLYKKYNLTTDEIAYIESLIKPM